MKRLSIVVLALLFLALGTVVVCAEEVQVGDWVVNIEGSHFNIFFKGIEVINSENFQIRLDTTKTEATVYSFNYPANETFKEKVEKKGAGKVITTTKQDSGVDFKRVINIYPEKIIADYTVTIQGPVGKTQLNQCYPIIPEETFANKDRTYSILNGDNTSEKTLSLKTEKVGLAYGLDGVMWQNKGINFEIHLVAPSSVDSAGKPAVWWLADRRADPQGCSLGIAPGVGFYVATGDVVNFSYEIRCSKAK